MFYFTPLGGTIDNSNFLLLQVVHHPTGDKQTEPKSYSNLFQHYAVVVTGSHP